MHEFSLASTLAEKVIAFAEERAPIRIIKVRLAIGELMGIQSEQLSFCYHVLVQDTPARDSSLEIEPVATIVNCPGCGYTGRPKYWDGAQWLTAIPTMSCPQCGANAEAIQGNECSIRNIAYAR